MVIKNGQTPDAEDVVESIGRLISQNINRILKSDTSVFVNELYSGADNFTDNNGVMNTINVGNTTAYYDGSDFYFLKQESVNDTTHDPNSVTNPENAFDGLPSTSANFGSLSNTNKSLGKTFSSRLIGDVRVKANITSSGSNPVATIKLQSFNGTIWSDEITLATMQSGDVNLNYDSTFSLNSTVQGLRIELELGSVETSNGLLYILQYGDFLSSTVETDSIITNIVPKSIVVFGETVLPTNTSITVDVSDDGGTTFGVTGVSLNNYIDTTSLSGSDLALKFNLSTTDGTVTPELYGYGVVITDS